MEDDELKDELKIHWTSWIVYVIIFPVFIVLGAIRKLKQTFGMSKLQQLSEVFGKNANVVIFCSEDDRKEIFEELSGIKNDKSQYGVFDNSKSKLKASSAMIDGKTFHFISEDQMDALIGQLEKTEIG